MNQRLIRNVFPLGHRPQLSEQVGVDPYRDRFLYSVADWRPADRAHSSELLVSELRNIGVINLAVGRLSRAHACSPAAH